LNETHQLDACTDVSLLDKNVNTDYKERHRMLSVTSKMIGVEVNTDKTKYTFMS
jgi:hypothetical protein